VLIRTAALIRKQLPCQPLELNTIKELDRGRWEATVIAGLRPPEVVACSRPVVGYSWRAMGGSVLFASIHASMAPKRREAFSVKPYSSGSCAGARQVPNNLSHTGQSA
jgi:hypothetical protein